MNTLTTIVTASVIILGVSAAGAEQADRHLKKLFTRCAPMALLVDLQENRSGELGLTTEDVVNAVEGRLRAARLFNQSLSQGFTVHVMSIASAFSISVDLRRWIADTGFGRSGMITVWSDSMLGTHRGNGQFVLGSLSRIVDKFLTQYLRANQGHCAAK